MKTRLWKHSNFKQEYILQVGAPNNEVSGGRSQDAMLAFTVEMLALPLMLLLAGWTLAFVAVALEITVH